jgi:hypothetical protein
MTEDEFDAFRHQAKRILGYMPIQTPCVTCQTPDADLPKQSVLPNRRCLIRRCVDRTGIVNCAYCARFPCDTLQATAGLWTRHRIESKRGSPLSDEEYRSFVEPFEGLTRLAALRASLPPDAIVEPATVTPSKTRLVAFPEDLPVTNDVAAFKAVYTLLASLACSSLGLSNPDTFAQHHTLETHKAHLFRFLWILGTHGTLESETASHLVVDAATYHANRGREKRLALWAFVHDVVFKGLAELGVCCDRVVLTGVKTEDVTTGTGYLRKRGWVIRLSFAERIGGTAALHALHTYATTLDEHFGSRGLQRFRRADMRILLEP